MIFSNFEIILSSSVNVMVGVGSRGLGDSSDGCDTVPAVLQYRGYCSQGGGCEGERAAARVGGAGNAGRGASPTAGKREGISF